MPNRLILGVVLLSISLSSYLWAYKDPFIPVEPPQESERPVSVSENIPEAKLSPAEPKWPVSNPVVGVSPVSKHPTRVKHEIVRPELDISGLFWGGKYNLAIIQDKIFYEGDKYDELCTIVSIMNGKLILKCQDKVWTYETKERNK